MGIPDLSAIIAGTAEAASFIGAAGVIGGLREIGLGIRGLTAGQGATGPPGGLGSPGDFGLGLLSAAAGDDSTPALNFWRLTSAAVQIAQQLGGDRSSGSRRSRVSRPRSTGEFFRTGDEETVPCGMNPNVRCAPGAGPETQNPGQGERNPLDVRKDPSESTRPGPDPELERAIRRRVCIIGLGLACGVTATTVTGRPEIFFPLCGIASKVACEVAIPEPRK